jgi:transposase
LTDEQWALIEPLLPAPRTGGRPEKHPRRSIVDGILYVVRTGCAWRYLPADFPPWQTVYWYFKQWEQAKVTEVMLAALREQARVQQGRNPQPSAGIIDSQSVKGADTVGRDSRGYDAAKIAAGSGLSSPTPWACSSWSSCSPRACKTVTVPRPPCFRRT